MPSAPLIVKSFRIDPSAAVKAEIVARPSGLWALLTGRETTLQVTADAVTLRSSRPGFSGIEMVPASAVASTRCENRRPVGLLVAAIGTALLGLVFLVLLGGRLDNAGAVALLWWVVAAVLVGLYFFLRSIVLGVETAGGSLVALHLKPGLASTFGFDQAFDVANVINGVVLGSHNRAPPSPPPPTPTSTPSWVTKFP